MKKTRLGLALAACALLAACASSEQPAPAPAPAPAPPPPPPPAPAASFDGVYSGTVARVRTPPHHPKACVASHHTTIHIANGAFTYRVGPKAVVHGTVQPGGEIDGTAGDVVLKGQIADGHLTGTTDGKSCGYTLDLTKH